MLTTEAFNALLKTLEEPPAHAIFVLATTEAHKVPATIVSRTQRFNFRPIHRSQISNHLRKIANIEHIKISDEALELLASAAQGGMRDALGLLDQVRSTTPDTITAETLSQFLGLAGHAPLIAIIDAVVAGRTAQTLEQLGAIMATGAQPAQIALQLAELGRQLLRGSVGAEMPIHPSLQKLADAQTPNRIIEFINCLLEAAKSPWPELALEVSLVKLANANAVSSLPSEIAAISPNPKPKANPPAASLQPAQESLDSPDHHPPTTHIEPGLWPKVLILVKSKNNSLAALLQMYDAEFLDQEIIIKPRFNFHRDLFLKPANRSLVEAAAAKVYTRPIKVSARIDEPTTKTAVKHRSKTDPNSELVSSALEILGGEVVD
jgi:DNA polymerase-3 subunit gamma/tau